MGTLKLYSEYIKMRLKAIFEYRISALIGFITIGLTNVTHVLFFWIIFGNIPTLNGWTLGQVLFLTGTISTAYGITHTFFAATSVWWVEGLVQHGGMDRMLMSPINILKHLFIYGGIDTDGLGDFIAGIAILAVASGMIGITWTVFNFSLYMLFLASAVVILLAFHIFISTMCFWVIRAHPIADVFFALLKFAEYPIDIFNPVTVFMLSTILPIGFISYYPAQIFVGQGIWIELAYMTPVVAIILIVLAAKFWDYGLKNYTSTGS